MEYKIKLIERFLHVIDQTTMLVLLDRLDEMMTITEIPSYFVINNTNPPLIRVLVYRLT